MNNQSFPHYSLCELIGQFTFTGNDTNDVAIAESIAEQYYDSIEDALAVIKGCVTKRNNSRHGIKL